ncbi:hypothetical protein SAMN05660909_03931 [Chitinophaga terrae (ex Kim and Jung 2007)]|uniref:Uncharacterized protein n=1 Tax=Chitinophaga terrae (ex Kim and Jung 2007) TaxID=408074 RepID=A0A1H4ESR7_9BACT|nr:DUF6528 family protein [Chitinophaga terrae (ex Kim and Jung 2007)]GEP91832.1 hypothetical protein CTE07_34770 [Chitinophaga terrae (ex Kim and Jung 2007)]SEA88134.1 hypothetical protein SAMN05660909_03931 [Chitinophaga terrae (ex Kim and Jung 2007)]
MRKIILGLLVMLTACSKNPGADTAPDPTPDPPAVKDPEPYPGNPLALTNNSTRQIEIYDPAKVDWNTAEAKKWRWSPLPSQGFTTEEANKFGGGTDFKVRKMSVWQNATYAAISDNSFAAIIAYPSGERKWSKILSGNLHSAELLPNGNLALAASDGNWIRVYATSQGANNNTYAEFPLGAAHAVLWDPKLNCLWVTGQDQSNNAHILTALAVGGTDAQPELTELKAYRVTLPTPWGHEISAYYGNTNLLWVTTNGGEYVFNKTTKSLYVSPTNNLTFVKGIGNQPSGQIVLVRPDTNKNPRPSAYCSLNGWATSWVDFYTAGGELQGSRLVKGACFYKVKIVYDNYQ